MTGAIQSQLGLSQKGNICPICTTGIEAGQTYVHLGCHPKHCVHDYCYDELSAFFKENTACPLCRMKVDPAKISRIVMQAGPGAGGNAVANDPFQLEMAEVKANNADN